jgi:hypothetical protein
MAFKFPHLLVTATFGSLSAYLSVRADAAEVKIGKLGAAAPSPQAEQEAARRTDEEQPANEPA